MWVCVKQNEGKRFPLEKISTLRMDDFWVVVQLVIQFLEREMVVLSGCATESRILICTREDCC
jgi:hypothetical protein